MELLPASEFSLEELTAIYNATRIDYLVPMPMSKRRMQEYIDTYDVSLESSVITRIEDDYTALCMLGVRPGRAWITRLGVLPTSRRHGEGQAMMEYVIDQARQRRLETIYLEVITGNTPAIRLFQKLGFVKFRELLILRRPPGNPHGSLNQGANSFRWMETTETLTLTYQRQANISQIDAWTNQSESLQNVGNIRGLHVISHGDERTGWVTFQKTALQLKRLIFGSENGRNLPPTYQLLYQLHTRFPTMDTIAENIPADFPDLDAFYKHGYIESFAREEMRLDL